MNPIEEVIQQMMEDPARYPVLRTRYTEERNPLPDSTRSLVIHRDHYRCVICGRGGLLEVDHIIPWSAGGSDDMDNLRTLCRDCNQERSNFKYPVDVQRRLPTAHECVYCNPDDLLGHEALEPVYCIVCSRKGSGIPLTADQGQIHHDDDHDPCNVCGHKKKAHVEGACFGFGMQCRCGGFELNREGLNA